MKKRRWLAAHVFALCGFMGSAQALDTWSWEPAFGYPGKWHETDAVWDPPDCCPGSYPNSATADARMTPSGSNYSGSSNLDGGNYTVNRLRFTDISDGHFTLTGNNGSLTLAGTSPLVQTGRQGGTLDRFRSGSLRLNAATEFNMSRADDGLMLESDAKIIGTAALNKTGDGDLLLSGANTYTGAPQVTAGLFVLDGTATSPSAITASRSGTLGGTGSVNKAITISSGGVVHPGAYDIGIGQQPLHQSCTLDAGAGGTVIADVRVACIYVPYVELSLAVDDGHAYARYGQIRDYLFTPTNTGDAAGSGVAIAAAPSSALDSDHATWACYPGSVGASCTMTGIGAWAPVRAGAVLAFGIVGDVPLLERADAPLTLE